jgi:hypothetical protein
MKSVIIIVIAIACISGFVTPLAYAETAYEICTRTPGSESLTRDELDECVRDTEQLQELHELRTESRHAETYNMQILALGGVIAVCGAIVVVVTKFVLLKKK